MNLNPTTLRKHILKMAFLGQSVHIPCAFSLVEVLSLLYSKYIKFNPSFPSDPTRDYLILSKGHGVMAQYACFKEMGLIQPEDIDQYFKDGSLFHGLSENKITGCEVNSGSLGHGLPIAVGIALGLKMRGSDNQHVYCIAGDGELNEGSMWEAIMFAGHHKLSNLTVIVDANQLQAMGWTKEILNTEPLVDKFTSFGFTALESDGHNMEKLGGCLDQLGASNTPRALIARTIKGAGVSFMENDNKWHYTRIDEVAYEKALEELSRHA